jgi:hypothetical protein
MTAMRFVASWQDNRAPMLFARMGRGLNRIVEGAILVFKMCQSATMMEIVPRQLRAGDSGDSDTDGSMPSRRR